MFNKYFSIILILNGTATYMDSTNPYKMNKVSVKGFTAPIIIGTRLLSLFDDDSEFLETRCRLDRFFYLPLVGIFLSWCVTSIIFRSNGLKGVRELWLSILLTRFIMIKYADRGLVEEGTTRPLFDYLYYLYNFVSSMVGLGSNFGLRRKLVW